MNRFTQGARTVVIVFFGVSCGVPALAKDPVVTLRSTISGNQEQPRVMYLLPWQRPDGPKTNQFMHSPIADELFVPIDREEFLRDLRYGEAIGVSVEITDAPE
ncbi:MAG: hypothetical protein V7754_06425 [Halioglobus sp.]